MPGAFTRKAKWRLCSTSGGSSAALHEARYLGCCGDQRFACVTAYYAEIGGGTAQVIIDRIVLATDSLLDWPYAGQELGATGWRKWKPRRTPHIHVYRPTEDGIEISRVRQARENWLDDL